MNNLIFSVKKFLKNKNTVTIIGAILILGILYFTYNSQIKKATNPLRIPVAKQTIQPKTLITSDMIEYVSMPSVSVTSNVIRNVNSIVNKYSNYNTTIPAGSMFYRDVVVNPEDLPDNAFTEVKDGEVVFNFPVTMATTYGNSIFPGNKIDIYMKAVDETGKIMVGKLVENVEVLAVKDNSGKNVFENADETRTPAFLIFGVSEEIHILLRKAQYMTSFSVVLFPVPHGGLIDTEGATQVSTIQLQEFINANTVNIPLHQIDPDIDTNNPDNSDNQDSNQDDNQNLPMGE